MTAPAHPGPTLVLYDGVCTLCNGFVRFLLPRDRRDPFRFAPLQSAIAQDILRNRNLDPHHLNTVCIVADYGLPGRRCSRTRVQPCTPCASWAASGG